jgi:glycosyltransferase involved in cell wall biosynthesis
MTSRLLIVSPVHNEAVHIERVVRAVAAQTVTPACWLVVDDASTDDTLQILRRLEPEVPFLRVIARPASADLVAARDRLARAAAPRAFNAGLQAVGADGFTHVMKLDGDVELPPHYLRELMGAFAADPALGLAGGVLVEPVEDRLVPIRIASDHVHGALKCYSRPCLDAIGGVPDCLGWDTFDEVYARMHGFRAHHLPDLVAIHHRPIGSADGTLRGHARHGRCAYLMHQPLYWVLARSARVCRRRPRGLSGAAFVGGWIAAAVQREPRVGDARVRRFIRAGLRERARHDASSALRALSPRR